MKLPNLTWDWFKSKPEIKPKPVQPENKLKDPKKEENPVKRSKLPVDALGLMG